METEIRTTDSNSQKKKILFITLICSIIGLTAIVFCIFGYLLNNYLHFEANKEQAKSELADVREIIDRYRRELQAYHNEAQIQLDQKKIQLEKLNESIAERQAKIAGQQNQVNEYSTLLKKIELLKKDYQITLGEYQDVNEEYGITKGYFSELKAQVESLETDKTIIKEEIERLSKQKKMSENSLASIQGKVAGKKQEFDLVLSKVTEMEQEYKKTEADYNTLKENVLAINDQLIKTKQKNEIFSKQQNALVIEVKNLEVQKKELSQLMLDLTNTARMKEKDIENAEEIIAKKNLDIELLKNNVTQLEDQVFKLKNKHDTLSAKVILAQETIAAKKLEQHDVEADILELKERKMDLAIVIGELEERHIQLRSQLKRAINDAPISAVKTKGEQAKR